MDNKFLSIIILTYSRPNEIKRNITEILSLENKNFEVIVVDNASEIPVKSILPADNRLKVIELKENIGVGGRNHGILCAQGDVIVTLDDDVFGFNYFAIKKIFEIFNSDKNIAAINFKVIDDVSEVQMNWIHHRKIEYFGDSCFETYEISEGAVAFRRDFLLKTNFYPEYYFISHEGPDLALQLIKLGYAVIYSPDIVVRHSHSDAARVNWRRYYYDTRNQIWLAYRHYPASMFLSKLFIGIGAMLVYSIRDKYFSYFLKGLFDAVKRLRIMGKERNPLVGDALLRYKEIEKNNPSILYMIKKRFLAKKVSI